MTENKPPLWFIYTVTLAGILGNTMLTPNIPDVLRDLGQPQSRAGLLVAAGPLPGIFIAPVIGLMADRFGRRRILLPCLWLFGAIAELSSWRWSLAIASIGLMVGFLGLQVLPVHRPGASITVREQLRATAKVIREPAILTTLGTGFLLFVVIFGVFLTVFPVHLENEFGLGPGRGASCCRPQPSARPWLPLTSAGFAAASTYGPFS